jgi:hypothetical protein
MSRHDVDPNASISADEVESVHAAANATFNELFGHKPKLAKGEFITGSTTLNSKGYFNVQPEVVAKLEANPKWRVFVIDNGMGGYETWETMRKWRGQTFESGVWRMFPPKNGGLKPLETYKEAA